MCCSRYDQHSYHLLARGKHRFEDAEVKNFASVNIVLTTIATVSTIVAHRSEDYDCLSVCLSFFHLFRYAYIQLCVRHIHEQFVAQTSYGGCSGLVGLGLVTKRRLTPGPLQATSSKLLYARVNSAFYPQRDGKSVATGEDLV